MIKEGKEERRIEREKGGKKGGKRSSTEGKRVIW
jgi:hypothetical protein